MKLVRCKKCEDVVRLVHTKWRQCECGKSGGQYNDDLMSATVGGESEVIGIRNDFMAAKPFSKAREKKDDKGELGQIIQGEYLGDVQIHRIKSGSGPKLKMTIEQKDDEFNTLTFTDKRDYTINVKGEKSPKSIDVPINHDGPSFKSKKVTNESDISIKLLIIEHLNKFK